MVEVLPKRSAEEKEILQVKTKEGESWMTPIYEYLVSGLLSEDPKESRKIKVKAPQYKLIRGNLYRRSLYSLWLHCVASPQTYDIVKEVLQDCEKCKEQSALRKVVESIAITVGSGWPFSHWGVNILGPLPIAPGGFKFLAIAIEHSTKWVEAKPLTVINGRHVERFVWEYVETSFSLTYGSEAIIRIPENDVAKDDRGRIKEVDKKRENKEIASIEEAYYRSKLYRHHSERSSHSIYKIGDFILLSQSNSGGTQVATLYLNIDKQVKDLRPHMSLCLIKRIKELDSKSSKSSNMMGDYTPHGSLPPSIGINRKRHQIENWNRGWSSPLRRNQGDLSP
ncbi:reverse transcriptase domain-containing protein [Tanacetum coccineum]